MGELVELDVTTVEESVTVNVTEEGQVDIAVFAETGPAGPAGPNSVTSATTSDGTANLSLSNVTTATATVTGTLNASHIHGNIAGSVYAHVRAGENLAKGDPVYISGSHGTGANLIAIVSKADASNAAKMPAVGVMDAAVSNNANGHMVITGTISDIDTNAYAVNSVLYVASGGGWTSTPPASNSQPVAIVERSNTNNGAVIVKVNGLASYGGNGASDANKLVRFGSDGSITVSSTLDSLVAITSDGTAVSATATQNGIAVFAESINQVSIVARSTNSTGIIADSLNGSYIVEHQNQSVTQSAIERVRGWFVWLYNTFTGRLKTANITANRDWTLPDKSGTILLDSDLGTNVATFLATPTSANLAAAVTGETGTGALVFGTSPTLVTPAIRQNSASFTPLVIGPNGTAVTTIADNINAVSGVQMGNVSAGTSADFRFIIKDSTDHYFAFAQPGTGNNQTLFGLNRNSTDYIFNAGGTARDICIGTFDARFLAFVTSSLERMRLTTGGELGVGTTTPSSKAILDLTSTTKGFLPPRMTTAQRDAITSVPAGLMIYNTSTNKLNFYNGSAWEAVTSA